VEDAVARGPQLVLAPVSRCSFRVEGALRSRVLLPRGGSTPEACSCLAYALVLGAGGRSFKDVERECRSVCRSRRRSVRDCPRSASLPGAAGELRCAQHSVSGLTARPAQAMSSRCGASSPDEDGRMSPEVYRQGTDGRPPRASTAGHDCERIRRFTEEHAVRILRSIREPTPATGPTIIPRPRRGRRCSGTRPHTHSAAPSPP